MPTPLIEEGSLFYTCGMKCSELISIGLEKFQDNKKLMFLKLYIDSRYGYDVNEKDILATTEVFDTSDVPYFLLFLLSDKQRYGKNVKLLWEKCTEKKTLFNSLIVSLLEYDCDPKLMYSNEKMSHEALF
jgi:hypothetical protein